MEESPFAQFVHLLIFLVICGLIIFVGWKEPLRNRFMTAQDLAAEHAVANPPPPAPISKPWRPTGTSLDRPAAPIRRSVRYYDPRQGVITTAPEPGTGSGAGQ